MQASMLSIKAGDIKYLFLLALTDLLNNLVFLMSMHVVPSVYVILYIFVFYLFEGVRINIKMKRMKRGRGHCWLVMMRPI